MRHITCRVQGMWPASVTASNLFPGINSALVLCWRLSSSQQTALCITCTVSVSTLERCWFFFCCSVSLYNFKPLRPHGLCSGVMLITVMCARRCSPCRVANDKKRSSTHAGLQNVWFLMTPAYYSGVTVHTARLQRRALSRLLFMSHITNWRIIVWLFKASSWSLTFILTKWIFFTKSIM